MVKLDVRVRLKCVKDRTVRHKKSMWVIWAEVADRSVCLASCSSEILQGTNDKDAGTADKQLTACLSQLGF